ncbi:MAG: hypothetical protein J6U42_04175, partial [Lachnospiraceae bacterium]|nr:hypothetical protein [Lachnospiraceae bacterium]
ATDGQYQLSTKAAEKIKEWIENKRVSDDERFRAIVDAVRKAVSAADERYAPVILKMAAEAAFDDEGRLVITESDVTL